VADDDTDPLLVERARAGDRAAFAVLVAQYQQALGSYLAHLTGDHEVARDLAQETFLRAYRALGSTRPGLRLRPWLYKIATNLAYDHLRRRGRIAWVPLSLAEPHTGAEHGSRFEEQEIVRQAMARLGGRDRAVLLLCGLEGLSYAEAGPALGCSPDAVRKQFSRAKERFRQAYADIVGAVPPEAA
jgi:RNA polymerase sigma-70 factor, ECF subfamily